MQGITTVSCRGLLICSVVFSSSVLANPAIDYKREEIEWCMINRESWQPCDACFFSLSPFSVGLFLLLFSWRRVVVHTGRPHRDSMDPRNALWKHRGKKHSYCALLANQKTSPTKISRNPLPPPFCSAHLVILVEKLPLLWNCVTSVGYIWRTQIDSNIC